MKFTPHKILRTFLSVMSILVSALSWLTTHGQDEIFLSNTSMPTSEKGTVVGTIFTLDGDIPTLSFSTVISPEGVFGTHNAYFEVMENRLIVQADLPTESYLSINLCPSQSWDCYPKIISIRNLSMNGSMSTGYSQNHYRLIAIPYNKSQVRDLMPMLDSTNSHRTWRMLELGDTPTAQYDDLTLESELVAGKGYWFLSSEPLPAIIPRGVPTTVDSIGDFALSLNLGWNMIGNPFTQALDWQGVMEYNHSNKTMLADIHQSGLYTYQGGYNIDSLLGVFQGGILNVRQPFVLKIPSPEKLQFLANKESLKISRKSIDQPYLDEGHWKLSFSLSSPEGSSNISGIGFNPESMPGQDKLDTEVPLPFEQMLSMTEKSTGLALNLVPERKQHTWQYQLSGTNVCTLKWDSHITKKLKEDLHAIIPAQAIIIDMKDQDALELRDLDQQTILFAYGKINTFDLFKETLSITPNPVEGNVLKFRYLGFTGLPQIVKFSVFDLKGSLLYETNHFISNQLGINIDELTLPQHVLGARLLNIQFAFDKHLISTRCILKK